ncbi:DUF1232 domain-containing protein [Candidatus Uhrbacteria bacterium]|nr:DUF1232 domain-containing protein [Candidatus Uhrbacteria bacterium]
MRQTKQLIPNWSNIWRFIRDPKSDWKPKVLAILAILYLIWPLDLAPDLIPLLGWLDDIGFDVVAVWYLMHATNRYLENKDK